MDTRSTVALSETAIRTALEDWADAVRAKDVERIFTHYASDIVAFDAIAQRDPWPPTHVLELGSIHQLARRAVRLGGVEHQLALVADHLDQRLGRRLGAIFDSRKNTSARLAH